MAGLPAGARAAAAAQRIDTGGEEQHNAGDDELDVGLQTQQPEHAVYQALRQWDYSGFAAQQRPVQTRLVREVCRDFDIRAPRTVRIQEPVLLAPPTPRSQHAISASEQQLLDAAVSASQ